MFRTIRWKLITSSLLAIGVPLIVFAYVLASLLWGFYLRQLGQELRSKALVIADAAGLILDPSTPDDPRGLTRLVDRWRRYSSMRITVADARGIIRAATVIEDIGTPIGDRNRPGLRAALEGQINSTVWKSPNFGYEDTIYVNVPVRAQGRVIGAVRVAYTLTQVQHNIRRIRGTLLLCVASYAGLIILLTVGLAGTIVRPVEKLQHSAQRLAAGDLDHRVQVHGTEEITQLGHTLNQMTHRLQQLEGMRRQYVSNVSHELRTPLAAIRGMAETLMQHGESDPALRERYLPRIITQTERLARLASQLLDLAQVESGDLLSSVTAVSMAVVLDDVVQLCAEGAAAKGVKLVVDVPQELPDISGERDRLVQVFLNLVDNALRYTPAGGCVTLTSRCEENQLTATVADTGLGIPAQHLPYIFERFYRVDKARSRQAGGTGLGLSIVRQIVEAHGGRITVESAADQGTRFTVTLPLPPPPTVASSPVPSETARPERRNA
jgi:signal transduction histidine kinase